MNLFRVITKASLAVMSLHSVATSMEVQDSGRSFNHHSKPFNHDFQEVQRRFNKQIKEEKAATALTGSRPAQKQAKGLALRQAYRDAQQAKLVRKQAKGLALRQAYRDAQQAKLVRKQSRGQAQLVQSLGVDPKRKEEHLKYTHNDRQQAKLVRKQAKELALRQAYRDAQQASENLRAVQVESQLAQLPAEKPIQKLLVGELFKWQSQAPKATSQDAPFALKGGDLSDSDEDAYYVYTYGMLQTDFVDKYTKIAGLMGAKAQDIKDITQLIASMVGIHYIDSDGDTNELTDTEARSVWLAICNGDI